MRKIAAIDFACNDPDNGNFVGRVGMVTFGDCEIEVGNLNGYVFHAEGGVIRIHGQAFTIVDCKEWFGNWCWDRYFLRRAEMKRLLGLLRRKGWRCTCGPHHFYRWFNQERAA